MVDYTVSKEHRAIIIILDSTVHSYLAEEGGPNTQQEYYSSYIRGQ